MSVASALPAGVEGRRIRVLGTWIRVAQHGRGPEVLLIHGSPGSVEDWQPIVDRLSERCRVTAFDRPGHGWSGQRRTVSVADNAEVAVALCDLLGLEQVTVVGHSYGGAVALAMAVERPRRVRAYITVAGALLHGRGQAIDPSYRLLALPLLGRGLARIVGPILGPGQVARGVRQAFQPNLEAIPAGFVERVRPLWVSPKVATTAARERVGLGPEQERSLIPRYPRIAARLVLVHGEGDRLVPARQSAEVARIVPGAELHLLEGVGHYLQYARPAELAGIIESVARPV